VHPPRDHEKPCHNHIARYRVRIDIIYYKYKVASNKYIITYGEYIFASYRITINLIDDSLCEVFLIVVKSYVQIIPTKFRMACDIVGDNVIVSFM